MTSASIWSLMALTLLRATTVYAQCSPVHVTALEARQRMMDLLHIQTIRPGYSGNANGPNPANYDEAKAGPFSPAPNPLLLNDGTPVTTARMGGMSADRRSRPLLAKTCSGRFRRTRHQFSGRLQA